MSANHIQFNKQYYNYFATQLNLYFPQIIINKSRMLRRALVRFPYVRFRLPTRRIFLFKIPMTVALGLTLYYNSNRKDPLIQRQVARELGNKTEYYYLNVEENLSFSQKIKHVLRFFHLIFIFFPAIITLPLRYFDITKDAWLDVFVWCVQRAGVVWIKAFQYLSHRRDMIGEQMANKFQHLRQSAPTHSISQTNAMIKKQFGKQIPQVFDDFNHQPIASGSVSQVYKAIYHKKKVAVKVRHPGVDSFIKMDVEILFFISKMFSKLSSRFQIPVGSESMKRTLTQQIDFRIQAENMDTFSKNFAFNSSVDFPQVMEGGAKQSVLIQTFVDALPVTYYMQHPGPLNKVIARIGATSFFQMLMKHNFIHADCHGGNIFVSLKDRKEPGGFLYNFQDFFLKIYRKVETTFIKLYINTPIFRQLYTDSLQQQEEVAQLEKKYGKKVIVTLIDTGMVIKMDDEDRNNFVNFIRSVISQQPQSCAKMIYSLSINQGEKIIQQESNHQFRNYYKSLNELFGILNQVQLKNLDGTKLFRDMLDLIRSYSMKLDGQFATLLTNMLVLEAIAKELNPQMNILKCAVPYFEFA